MKYIIGPRLFSLGLAFAMWAAFSVAAQDRKGDVNKPRSQASSVGGVTPIFSQLVMFFYPPGFKLAYQDDNGAKYIQESVLDGETVEKWSQMVTVSGVKGLATNPNVTPQRILQQIAGGFQRACPNTFTTKGLGTLKVSGHDAFAALIGCGAVQSGIPRSEVALIISVKGSSDYYSIQWAERGVPSNQPLVLDDKKWLARLKQLNPIKLCARVPGEPAPYVSCINQRE